MTDERQKVLEMLECGKITQDEASKLLALLGKKCPKSDFEQKMSTFKERFENKDLDDEQKSSDDTRDYSWNFSTGAKDFSEKVKIAVNKAMSEIDIGSFSNIPFVAPNGNTTFNATDSTVSKQKINIDKQFSQCAMELKYTKGAFVFSGDFAVSNREKLKRVLKPFVTQKAWDIITELLDEQFTGNYKMLSARETLKLQIL